MGLAIATGSFSTQDSPVPRAGFLPLGSAINRVPLDAFAAKGGTSVCSRRGSLFKECRKGRVHQYALSINHILAVNAHGLNTAPSLADIGFSPQLSHPISV